MRWRALAGALLAAALAAPVTATAYRAEQPDSVLAVPADGSTVETVFVAAAGVQYTVTVWGTFARNARGGLADCGYADVNDGVAGQDWQPGDSGLLVNGARASCGAYDDQHRYSFGVLGTGTKVRFAVADPSYGDNAGALTVAVVTDIDLDAECVHAVIPIPNSSQGYVVVAAEAHVKGTRPDVWSTRVSCVVSVGGTWVGTAAANVPGRETAVAERYGPVPLGPVRKCLFAEALTILSQPLAERGWPCV